MNSSNLSQSLSEQINSNENDRDLIITDDDIDNIESREIPELQELINAKILLTKQKRSNRARNISRNRKRNKRNK